VIAPGVAQLLRYANAAPPPWRRAQFYALKDRLCRTYGVHDGYDVQHIRDLCWGLDDAIGCPGTGCRKCGGTGVYRERTTWLERWSIAGRIFHRPLGPIRPDGARALNVIQGRIVHRDVSARAAREATLLLALVFDRPLFWPLFAHGSLCSPGCWPLCRLNKTVAVVRGVWPSYVSRRTCPICRREFRPLFRRRALFMCRRCLARPAHVTNDAELPF